MISERGYDRENADLLEPIFSLSIHEDLLGIVEEGIMVVIQVVNADFKNALSVVFLMRLDELHSDVQMMERLHAEIIFLAVVLDKSGGVNNKILLRRQ